VPCLGPIRLNDGAPAIKTFCCEADGSFGGTGIEHGSLGTRDSHEGDLDKGGLLRDEGQISGGVDGTMSPNRFGGVAAPATRTLLQSSPSASS
jgi:hypothetical protein